MNWKDFLKPTVVKLLVFTILFTIFVPFLYYNNGCINKICGTSTETVSCSPYGPTSIILLLINHFDGNNCVTLSNIEKMSTPFTIFGLLVTYLIACGVIALFYNIKK